jgi:hypothetical protein
MGFDTLNLGQIIQSAEAIKGMKRQAETDKLRDAYLNTQMQGAQQQQKFAAQDQQAQMDERTAKQHYLQNQAIETAQDPKAAVMQFAPEIPKQYDQAHGEGSFDLLHPEEIKSLARFAKEKAAAAAGINTQPSPDVVAQQKFALERDQQNFGQQKELQASQFGQQKVLAGMQQGQQEHMAGVQHQYRLDEIQQQGANALMVAAQKANKNTTVDAAGVQKTWATYQEAKAGLLRGLGGTETGPIAGRIPAVTTAQQVAEGAVSAMAPVLKQIFRVAGEGTFTDKDQELLLRMVPTRTDTPEARQAKTENIDNIIQAKLGLKGQQQSVPTASGPNGQKLYLRNGQWSPQ